MRIPALASPLLGARLAALVGLGPLSLLGLSARADGNPPSFAHEVRPILSDRCFGCHGPADQEAGLRLDTFAGATEWVVVPGDADASEVIARVVLPDDDAMRMPPIHSGKDRLTGAEVAILRRWIEAGAEYEAHWAFRPVSRPEPPAVQDAATDIDRFVADRLADEGLGFLPEADRPTLLRRVAFDLTGLPPDRETAEAFLADESDDAYETLVDRLLASPRYGEHLTRYWLDAVRYADTHGKHFDNYREIWPYRDWVIRAFNANKPYDEFLVEQLAGDLLPDAGTDELVASGYNRCNLTTAEGGVIEQEIYTDNVRDRTDTFGTVVLGLTVACAKCHDHKYDPITQKDYYALFAFFNSLDGGPNDGNLPDHAGPKRRLSERCVQQVQQRHEPGCEPPRPGVSPVPQRQEYPEGDRQHDTEQQVGPEPVQGVRARDGQAGHVVGEQARGDWRQEAEDGADHQRPVQVDAAAMPEREVDEQRGNEYEQCVAGQERASESLVKRMLHHGFLCPGPRHQAEAADQQRRQHEYQPPDTAMQRCSPRVDREALRRDQEDPQGAGDSVPVMCERRVTQHPEVAGPECRHGRRQQGQHEPVRFRVRHDGTPP